MKIKCIAVDDEPLALNMMCTFIKQTPFLELSASCSNAIEALEIIRKEKINLVFLDIQMPDLNGMELARLLNENNNTKTRIIFTTAHDRFALDSYKVEALDYLLKPVSYEDFLRAATRAQNYFEQQNNDSVPTEANAANFLFINADYKMLRIDFSHITYIESVKDYLKIHLKDNDRPIMTLRSLKSIEEKLPAGRFIRIHRSYIVAIDKIEYITKNAIHIGGIDIIVGDMYRETFRELVKNWL